MIWEWMLPFARAAAKLKEHYGIEIAVSAVQKITEAQGAAMLAQEPRKSPEPEGAGVAALIVEMDGSMLPVVETVAVGDGAKVVDRRKTRQVGWREARLGLAHEPGSVTPIFGATLGSVEEAGEQLAMCTREAGAGRQTKFHGVDDGALWIREQMEVQWGSQVWYLLDFYHLCDYLAAAAEGIAVQDKPVCTLAWHGHASRSSSHCVLRWRAGVKET